MSRKKKTKEMAMTKPPPAFFRFLLMRGRVGHVILMTCVMVGEFLELYIPELYSLLLWVFTKLRLYNPNEFDAKPQEEQHPNDLTTTPGVNDQYSAFVDTTTGTAGGNKATKQQRQAAAKAATQKLKSLGETELAKYRHLSNGFMKRYVPKHTYFLKSLTIV